VPAAAGGESGDGGVRSLSRALALLEQVAAHPRGASLGDLAARADLAPSTAHRLLKGLEAHRFVAQDTARGLWFVGVQAFTVGAGFLRDRDVVAVARPFMVRLMESSGESVNLAILDGAEAVYLSQVESRQMMRALAPPGGRAPLHASGVGKAILSGMTPEEAGDRARALSYAHYTEKTIRNGVALIEDLGRARLRGFALDDEEHAVGLRCAAAPVFNEYGEPVAAVSVSGPRARIADDRLPLLGAEVRSMARAVTAALGGYAPDGFGPAGDGV
jgi:IclR family acetate operon transcriptional repressor